MLAAGSTIGRRYRLDSLIGEGGMASVWRASDETLMRSVAIKLLYLRPARDPQASVDQFLREARIAAAVQHRNVIHTVDFGTTDDGIPYMVMELLQGESLGARMARTPQLQVEELIRIAELTLRGLAAVHEAGIVHRDLKPQNIFLQQDGDAAYPKILDFGISRSLTSPDLPSPIATQQGIVLGTPHYMAPEQARGEPHIDQRADIYSMAAILYEGLTGQLPFDADNPGDLLVKIISTEAVPLAALRPDLPELLVECISQAMAHDREHRFVDASAFRRALVAAAERSFTGNAIRGSELPARAAPLAEVGSRGAGPAAAAVTFELPSSLQSAQAQNDVAPDRWGDFEGLGPRADEPAPQLQAAVGAPPPAAAAEPSRAVLARAPAELQGRLAPPNAAPGELGRAARPRAASVDMRGVPPPAAGADVRRAAPVRAASGELGRAAPPRAAGAEQGRAAPVRAASGELGRAAPPRAASAELGRAVPARAASAELGRIAPARAASAELAGARGPSAELAAQARVGSPDAALEAPAALVAEASRARAGSSGGMPRVSASEVRSAVRGASAQLTEVVNPNDGPLLGDNPLDAFAGSAAVALELDFERGNAPRTSTAGAERRASVAQPQPQHVGLTGNTRPVQRGSSVLWLLPAVLFALLCLLLIAPGLFSYAAPSDSSLRAREEQNPATRGSNRTLQRERPSTPRGTPPAERELWE